LTLSFQGLCLFADRTDGTYYDVLMPPSDGHNPVLMVRTTFLDEPTSTAWPPDFVVGSSDDSNEPVQTGIWLLKGLTLSFPASTGRLDPWRDRAKDCVDLARFHKEVRTRSVADIRKDRPETCSMVINEGTPSHRKLLEESVRNKNWDVTQPFAHQVTWSNLSSELRRSDGRSLKFRPDQDCYATISNLASGAANFALYYPLVTLGADDEPLRMYNLGGEVYDCVPPAPTS
jgi:hypothetical protein